MASSIDMTTLAEVRAWLGQTAPNATGDAILAPLITAASRMLMGYISRPFLLSRQITRRFDGNGWTQSRLVLPDWPVTSIVSLSIDNVSVPAAVIPGPGAVQPQGWLLEEWDGAPPGHPQNLDIFGYSFTRGRQNVVVTMAAGYLAANEPQAIPSSSPYTLDANGNSGKLAQVNGAFAADAGVKFSDGTALALVAGVPVAGQYAVAADTNGMTSYTFAAADAGKPILVSYSYVPSDLAQSCKELVAERYKYKDRIGEMSKSLGGQETVSFSQKDMPEPMKLILGPYRATVPI